MASDSLTSLAQLVRAQSVCIEAPLHVIDRFHSAASASALIQLTGALRAAAHRAGCKVMLVSVHAARRHFIGTARMNGADAKAAVMQRCRVLGWDYQGNDNIGDAMAVWSLGMALRYPKRAPLTDPLFAQGRAGT